MAGRPKKPKPPSVNYTAMTNYDKNKPSIDDLFSRTLKLLNEQLRRLKEYMFLEANMLYDKDIARQAKDLSTAVTSCGQMFFRIQDMAKQAADHMTTDEKIDTVCDLVRGFGRNNRYEFWRVMRSLELELAEADELT